MDDRRPDLRNRVAVATGATRGLGYAIARILGRHGATVVIGSRVDEHVASAVAQLRAEGVAASGRQCDAADFGDMEALRDHALGRGGLDIWVNSAGTAGVYGPTASTPVADFTRVVATNILGTFHGCRVALPVFLAQGRGDLVNLYGQGDRGPVALQNGYASSKRWVRQFTETLRLETRGTGVRVHGMNPGLVVTDLLRHVVAQRGFEKRLGALPVVVGLWGQTPEAAAAPIVDLVTSNAVISRDLTPRTLVRRGVGNVARGRLRPSARMRVDVEVIDDGDELRGDWWAPSGSNRRPAD